MFKDLRRCLINLLAIIEAFENAEKADMNDLEIAKTEATDALKEALKEAD